MNSAALNAWLADIPAERREDYVKVLERIQTILNQDRSYMLDQQQRIERRQDGLSSRQAEIVERLDRYEEQRAKDVAAEIDRMLQMTITRQEYDALMVVLYELTTRIAKLEPLQELPVRVRALELGRSNGSD